MGISEAIAYGNELDGDHPVTFHNGEMAASFILREY